MLNKLFQAVYKLVTWYHKIGLTTSLKLVYLENIKKRNIRSIYIQLFGNKIKLYLRTATTDISVFQQIFIRRDYDLNIPFVPINILDGGANIGLSSLFFAKKFPISKVFAIEPDSENYEILRLNTQGVKNINLFQAALWSEKCLLSIKNKNANKDAISVSNLLAENQEILGYNIDDIIKENGILKFDLIKLDIEGSECAVFSKNINWLKDVRVLIIELHDWIDANCSKVVFNSLLGWGFYLLIRGENLICFRDHVDYMETIKNKFLS